MKKREAITEIANRSQIKRELAIDVFNSTLDTFICALLDGEDITLREFGSFKIVTRKARTGRDPKTGETIQIPEKRVIKFVPIPALQDALNEKK